MGSVNLHTDAILSYLRRTAVFDELVARTEPTMPDEGCSSPLRAELVG